MSSHAQVIETVVSRAFVPVHSGIAQVGAAQVSSLSAGAGGSASTSHTMAQGCGANAACWTMVGMAAWQAADYIVGALKSKDTAREACARGTCTTIPTGIGGMNTGGYTGGSTGGIDGGDTGGNTFGSGGTTGSNGYRSALYGSGNAGLPGNVLNQLKEADRTLQSVKAAAESQGISLDIEKGTITTPRGSFTAAQLATARGLAEAGVTKKDLEMAASVAAQVQKNLASNKNGNSNNGEAFGGGGARQPASNPNTEDKSLQEYMAQMMAKNRIPAQKESLAGLSVLHNGEAVGISQSNIFETITRRYGKLQEEGFGSTGNTLGSPFGFQK